MNVTTTELARVEHALEGDRGDHQQRIAQAGITWIDQLLRKNADYGCAVWDSPVLAPDMDPGDAILVRMSDKISRLVSLRRAGKAEVDESVRDTLMDLGAYALLELARPQPEGATRDEGETQPE